jgi:hypothetical protein
MYKLAHFFSVERLFHELVASGQDALYPVTLSPNGSLGLAPEVISSSSKLFILLKYYGYVCCIIKHNTEN